MGQVITLNEISERETVLRLGVCLRGQPAPDFTVWTDDPLIRDMFKKKGWEVKVYTKRKGEPASWSVEIPFESVVFLSRRKIKARPA